MKAAMEDRTPSSSGDTEGKNSERRRGEGEDVHVEGTKEEKGDKKNGYKYF